MRKLNNRQKKLVDEWYEENKDLHGLGVFDLQTCNEFPVELLSDLMEINDFETIGDHIDSYISEKAMRNI